MKDGENGAVSGGVEKFVGVPTGGAGTGFGFAVANDASDDQIGIVESGAVGVKEGVAELAAFVNGAGSFGSDVTGDAVRPGELTEKALDAIGVALDVGVDFGVGAFQVSVRDDARSTVTGADDEHHVEVALRDHTVEMGIDEIQAGGCAPVAKETWLDVVQGKRALKERVVFEVDLADGEIVGGAPVGVHGLQLLVGQRGGHFELLGHKRLLASVCNSECGAEK
jgi:hypothetical protein